MKTASAFTDRSIRLSIIACIIGFGGFVIWGSFAKLDEGVTAGGQIVVEENRKEIQHLEGGIISALHVREGQIVKQGDILIELAPIQSETARDELAQEYAVQLASAHRLEALENGDSAPDFVSLREEIELDETVLTEIISLQTAVFNEQRAAHAAELDVLQKRRNSLRSRRADLTEEIAATQRSLDIARKDFALRQELLEEKLEVIANVSRAERDVSTLEATLSRLIGDRNQAIRSGEEVVSQITEAKARFMETVSEQLLEAQARTLTARERLMALDDRLARTVVRAPQGGSVLNLAHSTLGGVVRPGDTILEIVPLTDDLIVKARISPIDIDVVAPGQSVEAQLTAYKTFRTPRLPGEVTGVSADLKNDPDSGAYFYEVRVKLDASSLDMESRVQIIPGMPVDTFIASGNRRTLFDYVFEPIFSTMRRGSRMS